MNACKSCGAPVIWAISPRGKRQPIDADRTKDGNVILLAPTGLPFTLAVVLSGDALEKARYSSAVALRKDHHATCPDAESWRGQDPDQ